MADTHITEPWGVTFGGGAFEVKVFTPSTNPKTGWPDTRDGDCQIDVRGKEDYEDATWDGRDNWTADELRQSAAAMLAAADMIDALSAPAAGEEKPTPCAGCDSTDNSPICDCECHAGAR